MAGGTDVQGAGGFVERLLRLAEAAGQSHGPAATEVSGHDRLEPRLPVAENLLNRQFTVAAPNVVWVSDITYIPTREGWLYLATVEDLFSRRIVGWSLPERMTRQLVIDALQMAVDRRGPSAGLLHHSDRGSQYASDDYQAMLARQGMICSMSRRGNCWDNAVMASFYSTLKTELIYRCDFQSREEARRAIVEYIEMFYNSVRRHSSLGYVSPAAYELAL